MILFVSNQVFQKRAEFLYYQLESVPTSVVMVNVYFLKRALNIADNPPPSPSNIRFTKRIKNTADNRPPIATPIDTPLVKPCKV